jgi:hypothetical protein
MIRDEGSGCRESSSRLAINKNVSESLWWESGKGAAGESGRGDADTVVNPYWCACGRPIPISRPPVRLRVHLEDGEDEEDGVSWRRGGRWPEIAASAPTPSPDIARGIKADKSLGKKGRVRARRGGISQPYLRIHR